MHITNKPEHDPVADLLIVDGYMLWAMMAAEEVIGKNGLTIVLREAGLERLVGNFPPNQLKFTAGLHYGDYAAFNAGLLNFFGRAAKSMTLRIGRQTTRYALDYQSALFGTAALLAAKVLPVGTQLKMGLAAMQLGLRRLAQSVGQDLRLSVEDRGNAFAYVAEDCPFSAGKLADEPVGWIQTGAIQEALRWQTGKEFEVEQVACRSMGAPASVWLVYKTPKIAEA